MSKNRKKFPLHYWTAAGALLIPLTFSLVILKIENHPISKPAIDPIGSLVWPSILASGLLLFREHCKYLFEVILKKVSVATELHLSGVVIKTDSKQIPAPAPNGNITLANAALLHTSFLRPDKTRDGMAYYQIEVVIIARSITLDRIDSVTYRLDEAYPPDQRTACVRDRSTRFKLKQLANGTSIIRAEVNFKDREEPLLLNRFIDLHPTGARI